MVDAIYKFFFLGRAFVSRPRAVSAVLDSPASPACKLTLARRQPHRIGDECDAFHANIVATNG